jgi:hypothetical protein
VQEQRPSPLAVASPSARFDSAREPRAGTSLPDPGDPPAGKSGMTSGVPVPQQTDRPVDAMFDQDGAAVVAAQVGQSPASTFANTDVEPGRPQEGWVPHLSPAMPVRLPEAVVVDQTMVINCNLLHTRASPCEWNIMPKRNKS